MNRLLWGKLSAMLVVHAAGCQTFHQTMENKKVNNGDKIDGGKQLHVCNNWYSF